MTIKSVDHATAAKGKGDAGDDLEEPDDEAPLVRGEDGEYNMTRG